uniref:Uncharacterized protein n=1 Tax=Arundo donax TaxID=35708 RepID=A0A0A8YWT0_ARUDO
MLLCHISSLAIMCCSDFVSQLDALNLLHIHVTTFILIMHQTLNLF